MPYSHATKRQRKQSRATRAPQPIYTQKAPRLVLVRSTTSAPVFHTLTARPHLSRVHQLGPRQLHATHTNGSQANIIESISGTVGAKHACPHTHPLPPATVGRGNNGGGGEDRIQQGGCVAP